MSNTATVVELKNAGESITIGVESCALMTIGKYPEVEFIGNDGSQSVAVRVNQKSADRQLARIGLDYASAAGKILTLSRSANPADATKPYWNINLAGTGTVPKANGKPPVQRANEPINRADIRPELPDEPPPIEEAYNQTATRGALAEAPNRLGELFELYDLCWGHAHKISAPGEDTAAMAATLFIEANKRGIRA